MLTLLTDLLERPIKDGYILRKRFKISRYIGKGSYGMVYQAEDLVSNQWVVVKQLRKRKRKARMELLEREAEMLSEIDHPSIPKVVDWFIEAGESFLVMNFIKGRNVEDLIFFEGRKFSERESFKLLLDVLYVIRYLHEIGIIHRDLRLPNILLQDNDVFIIDFGLAVFIDQQDPLLDISLPLEKRMFREISYESDFYALGHFVLFLLYSNFQIVSKKEQSWEEELKLGVEEKRIIRKLLRIEQSYENVGQIINDVELLIEKDN